MAGAQDRDQAKAAMREALEASGQLDSIKAQLRAIVYHSLDASSPESRTKPQQSPENMLINELIREYLAFNGYEHTLSVLRSEASMQQSGLPRAVLKEELGYRGAPAGVPVLYAIVAEAREEAVRRR